MVPLQSPGTQSCQPILDFCPTALKNLLACFQGLSLWYFFTAATGSWYNIYLIGLSHDWLFLLSFLRGANRASTEHLAWLVAGVNLNSTPAQNFRQRFCPGQLRSGFPPCAGKRENENQTGCQVTWRYASQLAHMCICVSTLVSFLIPVLQYKEWLSRSYWVAVCHLWLQMLIWNLCHFLEQWWPCCGLAV